MRNISIHSTFSISSWVLLALRIVLVCLIPLTSLAASTYPAYGIIYNSTVVANRKIALGINPEGHLNAGANLTPALTTNGANNSMGIAYYWANSWKDSNGQSYPAGWADATSPGWPCEGWGVSATDGYGTPTSGHAQVKFAQCNANQGIVNVQVKNFVVDTTSILSTVWIMDSKGNPMLEVNQRYGPSLEAPDQLFQGVVTISNISGGSLTDIRYRRVMDWDAPPNGLSSAFVTNNGVSASLASPLPHVIYAGDNGFGNPDPLVTNDYWVNTNTKNVDYVRNGPTNHGASLSFAFGDLGCGESVSFMIYYGAASTLGVASSGTGLLGALKAVGAEVYSIGESSSNNLITGTFNYPYAFGFKGVSGTAVAPTIPPKTAILPAGIKTDPTYTQTYTPPLLSGSYLYQATFQYRAYTQWPGDIKRYGLDTNGNVLSASAISAASLLQTRSATVNVPYASGGRSIWTIGKDPVCLTGGIPSDVNYNNFSLSNTTALGLLMFNCSPVSPTATNDLINFVRGLDAYWEGTGSTSSVRPSVLADTFHSEMVMVGPPNAAFTTDSVNLANTEAYYRGKNNYLSFITSNASRRKQLYVGANDGMLHAFDENLNERWAFIPPSVLSHLREMVAIKGTGPGLGTSNTVFNVDGPVTYKDIYSVSEGKWKTILMGGLGYGGKSYYALDITDPDKPLHLFTVQNDATNKVVIYWDAAGNKTSYPYASAPSNINYSTLGDAWSRPVLMLLPYIQGSVQQKWVAVFGGGYAGGTSTGTGAQVFILDMDSNSGVSPISSGGQILTNIAVPSDPASSNNIVNGVPSHLTVVSSDGTTLANYYGGIGYFTDLQGQLWKLNLSKKSLSDANSSSLGLIRAFKTEATQLNDRYGFNMLGTTVVQGTIAGTSGTVNRVFNYFGTGDITHLQRRNIAINNRIYGVQDADFPGSGLTLPNLTVSSSSFANVNTSTCSVQNSWYADVWAKTGTTAADDHQKIVGRAAIYNKNVYFSAYKPGLSCGTGTSALIEFTDGCSSSIISAPVSGLATAPVIDNKGNIYVGLSNVPVKSGGVSSILKTTSNASKSSTQIQYRSWREKRN